MTTAPAQQLLLRAETAIATRHDLVFVEVVPWRSGDPASTIVPTIPGAHRAGVREVFAGTPQPGEGHLPLPDARTLRRRVFSWLEGRERSPFVLFTRNPRDTASATRAWFTLSWAGFSDVCLLLGGLDGWIAAGGPIGDSHAPTDEAQEEANARSLGAQRGAPWPVRAISAEELADVGPRGTLLDGRPPAEYAGFADDPRSGHVPGAASAPASELLDSEGALLRPAAVRRWMLEHNAIGSHHVAAYCNGGVASSLIVFAAALIGQSIDLYVDSWSGWTQGDHRPVAHGEHRISTGSARFACFDPL
ncbi:sulfurtransferase [Leucobacter chromiiresistens]|uniref:thiosulfate sulfurtransferase n=1 Tax=Leucobacter chromiiresistens TaxID=1079994 RepID=A0A1H1A1V6_9MICO|nr:rhodanese-like domain-containing protein [Leucobacter chromiiresistens]SDQ33481.1 thiosulfate/3-mercaptopyruvate sulfurtransferase [Leucobacter chromiiresistens]